MSIETLKEHRSFGGTQGFYRHQSPRCGPMRFAVYQPPRPEACPVVFYLSGLTCTEENAVNKAGAQRVAAELGLIVVMPDTSPRGAGYPGEDEDWDFGTGAGFYVDATEEPWSGRYQMYSYVTAELPALIDKHFPSAGPGARAITGHSMGGHGALVAALRAPEAWRAVSALAPIAAPTRVPWGEKAFSGYLGQNREVWSDYDACALLRRHGPRPGTILVDQGTADGFLEEQLRPELLREACDEVGQSLELRLRDGYDHSYFFVASFIEDHLRHLASALRDRDRS